MKAICKSLRIWFEVCVPGSGSRVGSGPGAGPGPGVGP